LELSDTNGGANDGRYINGIVYASPHSYRWRGESTSIDYMEGLEIPADNFRWAAFATLPAPGSDFSHAPI